MFPETFTPKNPIFAKQRAGSLQPLSPTAATLVKFRGGDNPEVTNSLPKWTHGVKDPSISLANLNEQSEALEKKLNGEKPPGLIAKYWAILKLFRQGNKLYKELRNDTNYLPKTAQDDLKQYHRTGRYWLDLVFDNKKTKLMDVVYQGPLAIKAKQQQVSMLPALKKAFDSIPGLESAFIKPVVSFLANRQFKKLEVYTPLLNQVPPLPYAEFEKQINELKKEYDRKYSDDPIKAINKEPIGTGSMGQVYKATTQSGKNIALKLIRPKLTESFLDDYKPYIYYRNLLLKGVSAQSKLQAVQSAESSVALLKGEIHPEDEAVNTNKMQSWAKKLQLVSFQVPEVLASTKFGLAMPYVGEKDFANLTTAAQDKIKVNLAPDLAKFLLLAGSKPLDLHNGNFRSGANQSSHWIDHGRQVNLSENSHDKLLKLMIAAYKSPNSNIELSVWDNALLQPEVRSSLRELLNLDPSKNKQAIQKLDDLSTIPDLKNQVIKQKAGRPNSALTSFNELEKILSQALGQPQVALKKPQLPTLSRFKPIEQLPGPSVLNAWASSAMNISGFAETKLSRTDISQYKQKTAGFLTPYLQATSQKEIDQKLEELANQTAQNLIAWTDTVITDVEKKQLATTLKNAYKLDLPTKPQKTE